MNDTSISDPRVGTVLQDRYRILARLAAGGMGVVYRAERLELGRAVAIKFLHPWVASDPEFQRRFQVEARAMGLLSHPCCVSVIDFGVDQGSPYMVMEHVTGETLRLVLQEGPVRPSRAVEIVRQVLAGLEHAHGQGIVHRDIKPENIILSQAIGIGEQVRILDFGVAKLRDGATALTMGMMIGTPGYMAPEQIRGEKVDARTDVYATGILLFELLTGKKPFDAEQTSEILLLQQQAPVPRLGTVEHSAALEAAVRRALEKSPARRFGSASEFAAALDQTPEAQEPSPREAGTASLRRSLTTPLAPTVSQPSHRRAATARELRRATSWVRSRRLHLGLVLGGALLAASVALVLWPKQAPPPVETPAVKVAITAEAPAAQVPELERVHQLIKAGRRDQSLAALAKLREKYPDNAYLPYLQGQVNFQNYRWVDGVAAYRAAIELDPAYRSEEDLIKGLIRCLGSNQYYRPCQQLLAKEIGAPALPYLEEASRSHEVAGSRRRSAHLLSQQLIAQ